MQRFRRVRRLNPFIFHVALRNQTFLQCYGNEIPLVVILSPLSSVLCSPRHRLDPRAAGPPANGLQVRGTDKALQYLEVSADYASVDRTDFRPVVELSVSHAHHQLGGLFWISV